VALERAGGHRRAYAVLSTAAIPRFPPPPLADQAVLVLRRLASRQQDALDVARG
jgi:hypothetical protein